MFQFEPWHLAAMEDYGYGTTSTALVNRVARYLAKYGSNCIGFEEFSQACYACKVDPYSFNSRDFDQLRRKLKELT